MKNPAFLSAMQWFSFMTEGWHSALIVAVFGLAVWWQIGRVEAALIVIAGVLSVIDTPLKLIIGRPRPPMDLVQVLAYETGNGYPSGHALFAILVFGFSAYLVFLNVKNRHSRIMTAGCLIALILLIGTSRVYLGVHWPSDVIGGYLIGGALLSLLVLLHQAWLDKHKITEIILDKQKKTGHPVKAVLIYNPHSGQVVVRREIDEALAYLRRCGWSVSKVETTKPKEATELASQAVSMGANIVIAAGGDGTVSEVANGLINSDAALGVLPVGTNNSWALQMDIPALNPWSAGTNVVKFVTDIQDKLMRSLTGNHYRKVILNAARVLVEGNTVVVDVGEISGRYFLMWAGIGLDAEMLANISEKEKRTLGSWAYLFNTIGTIGRGTSTDVKLTLDGKQINVSTQEIIVSNIQLYGGMLKIGAKARVNDAKLDVCIFKGDSFFTFIQHALKVLSHQHIGDPMIEYYQGNEMVIEGDRAMPVHLDGEPFTKTPVTIHTLPSALKVLVPKKVSVDLFVVNPGRLKESE